MVKENLNLLHVNCKKQQDAMVEKLQILEQNLDTPLIDMDCVSSMDLSAMVQTEWKKSKHLFNHLIKLQDEHSRARNDLGNLSKSHQLELDALLKHMVLLQAKLYRRNVHHCPDMEHFKELQSSLNDYVKKHRQLLGEVEEQRDQHNMEISILKQCEVDVTKENREIKGEFIRITGASSAQVAVADKLSKLLVKLNQKVHKEDLSAASMSQKLADFEVSRYLHSFFFICSGQLIVFKVEALSERNRANHTNNLYELVKEQLRKSEEKFAEFSKFGEGLVQKNLLLQERIVELEDQLLSVYTANAYKVKIIKVHY